MPPDDAPQSILLGNFAGIRNVVAPERLKTGDLELAINVDIDDAGQLRRRRGQVQRIAEPCHSLKTLGDTTLVVKSGVLGRLGLDFGFDPIVPVGPAPLCYATVADTIFYSSARTAGKLVSGQPAPWGEAIDGRWVSPVTRPDDTLGLVGGRLLGGVPNATSMETYKGRLYLAHERTIWATELYLYDLVDRTKNFLQFENDVTMIASVNDGLYVGTTAQLLFLQGTFSGGLKIAEVVTEGVVPGSQVRVPYSKAMPQARSGPVPEGYGPMFLTTAGVVIGLDGGQAYNLTQDRVAFPRAGRSASLYREDQGMNTYVVTIDSGGGPSTNARIGDYVAVEIVRQVDAATNKLGLLDPVRIGDIITVELAAGAGGNVDFSDPANSGLLGALLPGAPSTPGSVDVDFSDPANSGFLGAIVVGLSSDPGSTNVDFGVADNSGILVSLAA